MSGGTYTDNLADVKAAIGEGNKMLARLDERSLAQTEDIAEIKGHMEKLNDATAKNTTQIAVLTTRQKWIMGILGTGATTIAGVVISYVL